MSSLENYFKKFRKNTIGIDHRHEFSSGEKQIVYADWAASGRLYKPIEDYISNTLGPYVANTHTETTSTAKIMTRAYNQAHDIIKRHVNASPEDVLLFAGFGMTAVINKFQRILGLRVPEQFKKEMLRRGNDRPLIIITHMEHHSNQTTWEECLCDVEIINRKNDGLPDLDHLHEILVSNKSRQMIIGSFTACSNVTGIITPYHKMAEIMHEHGGYCFVDFSAYAPYGNINMHPENEKQGLDALFFSPHKFLGGPGSSGVIIFNRNLYHNPVPDHPGGGTVLWTNPWGGHRFFDEIEIREDGGTPGFLQAIKAALAVLVKEEMGVDHILNREHQIQTRFLNKLLKIPTIQILEYQQKHRLGFISFYSNDIHYNLFVKLLNDKFGIQTRGGCSCAGTYGHILLHIDSEKSKAITDKINHGDLSEKPGWVRVSLHPTMTDDEIEYIAAAIEEIIKKYNQWKNEYSFNQKTGDFNSVNDGKDIIDLKTFNRKV